MKAYIDVQRGATGSWALLVSEQDYFERGPHAHTYRTQLCEDSTRPKVDAETWAAANGYQVVAGPEQF